MADPGSERARGTVYCLLYDLCALLAGSGEAVPAGATAYTQAELREIRDPRQRLERYVAMPTLADWETALDPFFASGLRLLPTLEPKGSIELQPDPGGRTVASLRFRSSSRVVVGDGRQEALADREWVLWARLSPSLDAVEAAEVRAAAGG